MNRHLLRFLVIPLFVFVGLPAAAEDDDYDDDDIRKPITASVSRSQADSDCACPREGSWKVQNLEGWMDCTGPIDLKRKLSKVKDKGTIWILDTDCSSVFSEASRKQDEDALMEREETCGYKGTINGDEDGFHMVINIIWEMTGNEFIKGEMHSKPSFQGMMCEYFRPFEITFDDELPEDQYDKRRKIVEKKLKKMQGKD